MNQSSKTTTYKQRRRVKISGYTRKTGVQVRSYVARRIKKVTRTIKIKPRKPPKTAVTKAFTKRVNIRHHYRQITWINGKIAKNVAWKPTRKMHRMSVCINYYIRETYYSMRLQIWAKTRKELMDNIDQYKQDAIKELEKYLGYPENMWWFRYKIGIEYPTKMPYDKKLIGTQYPETKEISKQQYYSELENELTEKLKPTKKDRKIEKYFRKKKQK